MGVHVVQSTRVGHQGVTLIEQRIADGSWAGRVCSHAAIIGLTYGHLARGSH